MVEEEGWSRISPEVAAAQAEGRAVVALESTLIAQGLPWPHNLEAAPQAEAEVRAAGAVPATIAILGGRDPRRPDGRRTGDDRAARPGRFLKASRREPGAGRRTGARRRDHGVGDAPDRAGRAIGVMATGGLGGVHRDAATSFDISTDLDELARADGRSSSARGSSRSSTCRRRSRRSRRGACRSSATAPMTCRRSPPAPAACPWMSGPTRPPRPRPWSGPTGRCGLPGAVVLAQPVAERRGARPRRHGSRPGRGPRRGPGRGPSPARPSPRSSSTGSARPPPAAASTPTSP